MCGICGIVARRLGADAGGHLDVMSATLRHRGPDDEARHLDLPNCALGFRRLAIIDPAGSRQPVADEAQRVWAACNGEIYNYIELREALERRGHVFRTRGDSETVVHAYEEWGDGFLDHLRGMFALALWDGGRRRLLLARDRLGIKPLHYAVHADRLVFGSELKAVLAHPGVSAEPDPAALDLYLSLLYVPSPRTVYAGIRKLPPATALTWEDGVVTERIYWRPPAVTSGAADEGEAAAMLRGLLEESVRLHLRSDVPIAFFLSGGLDSGALVALASRAGGRVRTLSVGFDAASHNELAHAARVARAFGTDHHEIMVRADAADVLPAVVAAFDEPFADSSAIPTHAICRAAAQTVKVVVGGDGGDELFVGYEWTRRQRFVERWQRVPAAIRRAAAAAASPWRERGSAAGQAARFLADTLASPLEGYARRVSCFTPALKDRCRGPGWPAAGPLVRETLAPWFAGPQADAAVAMNRADLGLYLPDDDLTKVDRLTMLHSIEGRVPLLDHRLVEYAAALPMDLKLRGGTTKYILKRAMADLLPPQSLRQRKQGFAVPIARWMRTDLRGDVERLLLSDPARRRGLFDPGAVRWMIRTHASGRGNFGHALWAMTVLELWHRLCFETRHAPVPAGLRLRDV